MYKEVQILQKTIVKEFERRKKKERKVSGYLDKKGEVS